LIYINRILNNEDDVSSVEATIIIFATKEELVGSSPRAVMLQSRIV